MDNHRSERDCRFRAVVDEVADPVQRYLRRRLEPDDAADVFSETMLVLWRRLDDIPADRIPWAIGVARLQTANADRSRRRRSRLTARLMLEAAQETQTGPGDSESDHRVRSALDCLKPADAELLRLWIWEELTPRELAVVLGISANAASVRLHRARKNFAVAFGKQPHDAGHTEEREGRRP